MLSFDEREQVKRAQKDPEAFGVLYDEYYPKIFRFILHRTGNMETAKDLTAETFFQALKNLWRFRFMRRPFSAWLYKIAATQIAMYFREYKRRRVYSIDESPELAEWVYLKNDSSKELNEQFDAIRDFQAVSRLIQKLKEVEQNVIVLRYMEEKSLQEISDILRININTVKSHIRRALMRLRTLYEKNAFSFSKAGESGLGRSQEIPERK